MFRNVSLSQKCKMLDKRRISNVTVGLNYSHWPTDCAKCMHLLAEVLWYWSLYFCQLSQNERLLLYQQTAWNSAVFLYPPSTAGLFVYRLNKMQTDGFSVLILSNQSVEKVQLLLLPIRPYRNSIHFTPCIFGEIQTMQLLKHLLCYLHQKLTQAWHQCHCCIWVWLMNVSMFKENRGKTMYSYPVPLFGVNLIERWNKSGLCLWH